MNHATRCRRLTALVLAGAVCFALCIPFTAGAQSSFGRVTQREQLLSGGSFVLLAAYGTGEEKTYYALGTNLDRKLDAVPVTPETPESDLPVWTIGAAGEGVSLYNGSSYLAWESGAYFGSSDSAAIWLLTEGEEGTFRFAADDQRAIGYHHNGGEGRFAPYETWDPSYSFDLLVYKLGLEDPPVQIPEESTVPEEQPEETTQPVDIPQETTQPEEIPAPEGTYILWNQSYSMALSGTQDASGDFTGTPVTAAGDALSGYGPEDLWTLETGEDGTSALILGGKKLGLGEAGATLQWDGPRTGWEMIPQSGDTWLIRNADYDNLYLCWNPRLRIWQADTWEDSERFFVTVTPATPEVTRPQAPMVAVTPAGGALYPAGGEEITLWLDFPAGEIYYALSADGREFSEFIKYDQPICPEPGFGTLWIKAYAAAPGYENSPKTLCCFTERTQYYTFYFGQLHAHTNLSDGYGTVEEAFHQASQAENLDFFAVTDHSDSFAQDTAGALHLDGAGISESWQRGKAAAVAVTNSRFVGIFGFEMTWNNGLGHINTFGTPGWASRDQEYYGDLRTALEQYYTDLAAVPGSVSQFNHPGDFHGNFEEFAHYSETADRAMALIEIFNSDTGDAYAGYIQALDQGWHLAPTCNQDNHSGNWGNLDSGRTVVLANTLTENNLYEAMSSYRVYATQDSDLELYYTLDGYLMGSRLYDYGPEVTIGLTVADATDGSLGTVEVIGQGGTVAATEQPDSAGTLSLTVPSHSRYYFLRFTQPDGNVAVTAPVWLEKVPAWAVTRFAAEDQILVAGQPQGFEVELTNRIGTLSNPVLTVTDASGRVLASDTLAELPGGENTLWPFVHTFDSDGIQELTLTVTAGGKTVTEKITVSVLPRSMISDVIVDGTHGATVDAQSLIAIAADAGIRAHVETRLLTQAQLEHCSLLVLPPPEIPFEPEFIELVTTFTARGGNLLLCGAADQAMPGTAARMNGLLSALGSTMTLRDDTVYDPVNNGSAPEVIFPEIFPGNNPWTAGIMEGQFYCHREGCSVEPGNGIALVPGLATTFSVDGDLNGLQTNGETYLAVRTDDTDSPKQIRYDLVRSAGEVCLMAAEQTAGGTVFLCGSGFPFGENLRYDGDNLWNLPYANRTILENILGILRTQPEVTPISQVRQGQEGQVFMVEGHITAGTSNPNHILPDTIYVQDASGGIAIVPCRQPDLALGTKVRITGELTRVNGDIRLQLIQLQILGEEAILEPKSVDNQTAMDYADSGGLLVQIEGTVTAVIPNAEGGIACFTLVDDLGGEAAVLVEDTVMSGIFGYNDLAGRVQVGNRVSAVGLVYAMNGTFLRVRNCDEVRLLWSPHMDATGNPPTGDGFPMEFAVVCMLASFLAFGLLYRKKSK